jgi:hypothetical protein
MVAKSVRFWALINGDAVKITLQHGQTLRHCSGGYTDEGYRSEHNTWTLGDDGIYREYDVQERDCDGMHRFFGEDFCGLDTIAINEPYAVDLNGGLFPQWSKIDSRQWDQYAEMMNY